jgi:hypothetical protein
VKTFFKWFIPNVLFALCWYLGAVENMSGFLFFGKAWIWFGLIISLLLVFVPAGEVKKLKSEYFSQKNIFTKSLDIIYDIFFCLFILYFGFGLYAFVYALSMLLIYAAINKEVTK